MRGQQGMALVITLVLLSGLGTLALAAAAAAMTALAVASQQQWTQHAFEAAEAGIAVSLERAAATRSGGRVATTSLADPEPAIATYTAETTAAIGAGALPAGFSIGENAGTFAAEHYFIVSEGRSARAARARLEQGFYLVVPAS